MTFLILVICEFPWTVYHLVARAGWPASGAESLISLSGGPPPAALLVADRSSSRRRETYLLSTPRRAGPGGIAGVLCKEGDRRMVRRSATNHTKPSATADAPNKCTPELRRRRNGVCSGWLLLGNSRFRGPCRLNWERSVHGEVIIEQKAVSTSVSKQEKKKK